MDDGELVCSEPDGVPVARALVCSECSSGAGLVCSELTSVSGATISIVIAPSAWPVARGVWRIEISSAASSAWITIEPTSLTGPPSPVLR